MADARTPNTAAWLQTSGGPCREAAWARRSRAGSCRSCLGIDLRPLVQEEEPLAVAAERRVARPENGWSSRYCDGGHSIWTAEEWASYRRDGSRHACPAQSVRVAGLSSFEARPPCRFYRVLDRMVCRRWPMLVWWHQSPRLSALCRALRRAMLLGLRPCRDLHEQWSRRPSAR